MCRYFVVIFLLIFSSCSKKKPSTLDISEDTLSKVNTKVTSFSNMKIDTSKVFGIWAFSKDDPHADFWLTKDSFFNVDQEFDQEYNYLLKENVISIFINEETLEGKILLADNDSLKIKWNTNDKISHYVRFDK